MSTIQRLNSQDPGFDQALRTLLAFDAEQDESIERVVHELLADVRTRGDEALLEHTRRLDRVEAGNIG